MSEDISPFGADFALDPAPITAPEPAPITAPEPDAPQSETPQPVRVEFIEDGMAFIREVNAAPAVPLKEVVVQGHGFRIRKVPGHEIAKVLTAHFRETTLDGETLRRYDAVSTSDQMLCKAIQTGVVKSDGKPLWMMSQVVSMWTGFDKDGKNADKYTDLLEALYEEVIRVNPTLHPRHNDRALQMMFSFNG